MVLFLFKKLILSNRAGNLVRRISRLSMVSIGVSTFAFLLILFVMNGMNKSIESRVISLEAHLTILPQDRATHKDMESDPILEKIKGLGAERYSLFDTQDVIIRTMEGQFKGAIAQGFVRKSFENLNQKIKEQNEKHIKKGSNFQIETQMWQEMDIPESNEILIGVDLARSLGVFEGDYLMVLPPESLLLASGEAPVFEKVKIKKILATNLADLDSQYIFYMRDLTLATLKHSLSRQVGIEVWLKDAMDAGRFQDYLQDWLLDQKEAGKPSTITWTIQTWMDRNSALFYALKLEKFMIGLFLGLAGLIASFSILTVLALLISQKKRDIAMLRTLGLSQKSAIRYFIQMGVSLSLVGVSVGAILGLVVGYTLEYYPINILPDIYYDSTIPAKVNLFLFFSVLFVTTLIAFLGSYLPTKAIEKISPAEVLRMKN
ncbi:MAG: ABC transporter permease [Bdellovibrionaceae bacterium]|nr:ABC transporter permease [Pseudobdellovibrionaceae bacterium]